jgi:CheY-like chemotaxis protein
MAERILLVDDNTTNLQVLFQALSPEGYELLVAQSGEQALEAVQDAKPDLILLNPLQPRPKAGMSEQGSEGLKNQFPSTNHFPIQTGARRCH